MRSSVIVLVSAILGLTAGIGLERAWHGSTDGRTAARWSPSRPEMDPGADPAPVRREQAVASGAGSAMRPDHAPMDPVAAPPVPPGLPAAVGDRVPASDPGTAPRRTRQQRAVSAQLDTMLAQLRGQHGDAGTAGDDAAIDAATDDAAAAAAVRVGNARVVLDGMLEGFAEATAANAPAADDPRQNDGRNR